MSVYNDAFGVEHHKLKYAKYNRHSENATSTEEKIIENERRDKCYKNQVDTQYVQDLEATTNAFAALMFDQHNGSRSETLLHRADCSDVLWDVSEKRDTDIVLGTIETTLAKHVTDKIVTNELKSMFDQFQTVDVIDLTDHEEKQRIPTVDVPPHVAYENNELMQQFTGDMPSNLMELLNLQTIQIAWLGTGTSMKGAKSH